MKEKIIVMSAVVLILLCGPLWADQRTFPPGSLIIPMDSVMQPDSDHGIFEAYGMLYALLDHKDASGDPDPIPIFWCVNPYKTSLTDIDFSVITDSG